MSDDDGFSLSDVIISSISFAAIVAYHIFHFIMLLRSPEKVQLGINLMERLRWVRRLMLENINQSEILAVQSLRNVMMAASFLATSMLVIAMGLMSHLYTSYDDNSDFPTFLDIRFMILTGCYFIAFLGFALTMRNLSHASYLVGIRLPSQEALEAMISDDHDLEGEDMIYITCCKSRWLVNKLRKPSSRTASHTHIIHSTLALIGKATTTFFLGMRFLYLSFPLLGWLLGSWGLAVGTFFFLTVVLMTDFA